MSDKQQRRDLVTKAVPFWALWGAPIVIILSMSFVRLPQEWTIVILSACLAWMGLACAINARRCRRRHCYYSSPVLLLGAALTLLVGSGLIDLGPDGLNFVIWGTFALVGLAFVPEKAFGKYRD